MAMARSLAHLFFLLLLVSTAPAVRTIPDAADNLQEACNKTLFPKVCINMLRDNPESRTASPRRLAELSVYKAAEVGTTVAAFAHHELNGLKDDALFKCLDSCSEDIEEAVAHLSALTRELTDAKFLEVKSWLSSTLGGTSTCEEACKDAPIGDVKNDAITKSMEVEELLRVTLDLITEASGSMSAEVALPPSALGASAPSGGYGSSADSPAYGAPSADGPAYGASGPGADVPAPSYGTSGSPAPSPDASASEADVTA
ncbi:pectinesterase inhibitor-like [Phragmites australis]|uniref:pectinesterase inhibitor-like n=1 Tax=Phragmites australis TaxID=29695 RepID=UPI002D766786|nr:pectinesterase inhibitor-like [Phragmites australis]